MRKIALILPLFTLLFFVSNAQEDTLAKRIGVPFKEREPFYEVIDTATATKEEIFTAAKSALTDLFKNVSSVIQNEDKEGGLIEGKGNYTYSYSYKRVFKMTDNMRAHFTLAISVKDHRYRVQLYNFKLSNAEYPTLSPEPYYASYKPTGDKGLDKMKVTGIEAFHSNALLMLEAVRNAIKQKLKDNSW